MKREATKEPVPRKRRSKRANEFNAPAPSIGERKAMARIEDENDRLIAAYQNIELRFLTLSQAYAADVFGDDRVEAALKEWERAPKEARDWMLTQPHPYGALIEWHKRQLS